jgi:pilus assembly protein Flp/PilA
MNKLRWLLALIVSTVRQAGLRIWSRCTLSRAHAARGQGLVEYALILVLIAIVVIGILTQLGGQTSEVFSRVSCTLDSGAASASSSHPGDPSGNGGGIENNTTTTGGC